MFRTPCLRLTATACILLPAALAVAPAPALATGARLAALGGGDFLEDDHNVGRWYGSLGDYPNQITFDTGHFTLPEGWHDVRGGRVSGPGLAVHLALDPTGRWGTVGFLLNDQGDDTDPGSLNRDRQGDTWTALWSRRFGPMQPTLMVRHGTDAGGTPVGSGVNPAVLKWDRARTEFGLGARWDLAAGAYLDLAGEVRRHREQTSAADSVLSVTGAELASTASYGLRARAFVQLGPTFALVPGVEYVREDRPLPSASPIDQLSLDGNLVKVGTGLNWYPDPDHFLVVAVDYLHGDADHLRSLPGAAPALEYARQWDSLSLTAGFETRFNFWLTFRGSFRYEPVSRQDTSATAEADFATFMVNLGATVALAEYTLDVSLTDQEPRSVTGYHGHSLFGNPGTWLSLSLRRGF